MRALEEAAQIVEAGFAAPGGRLALARPGLSVPRAMGGVYGLNLAVRPGDPIKGALNWKNNDVASATLRTGYILGEIIGEDFYLIILEQGGVEYLYGSFTSQAAPSKGSTQTIYPTSWALSLGEKVTLDVMAFVGQGTLGALTYENRTIGIHRTNFSALTLHGIRFFEDALTIDPTAAAAINSFSFTKA